MLLLRKNTNVQSRHQLIENQNPEQTLRYDVKK